MPAHLDYVCGCRSCGNHCMVVELDRDHESGDAVTYTDGFVGGWEWVQTEVVTCPHCGIVISWRKNCLPAELLSKAGDLQRFYLPPAAWGPPPLYRAGFRKYDEMFHPASEGQALPLKRLAMPPVPTVLWALRKRARVALGLLWLENDRERDGHYFGGRRPAPVGPGDEHRRAQLLRALVEGALFGEEPATEAGALLLAEWHRELGEFDDALDALDRPFDEPLQADRARQLRELAEAGDARVVAYEKPRAAPPPVAAAPAPAVAASAPADAGSLDFTAPAEPAAAPAAEAAKKPRAPEPRVHEGPTPRDLLTTVVDVLGKLPADVLTRKHIPRPYGALLQGLMKSYRWDEESFAVAVVRGLARAHGWPDDVEAEAVEPLEAFELDEAVLDYLATGFKRASWQKWAFDVPSTPPPRGK